VVKAAGWLLLDRQFEPYLRANTVACCRQDRLRTVISSGQGEIRPRACQAGRAAHPQARSDGVSGVTRARPGSPSPGSRVFGLLSAVVTAP
jgi:hypothetical protein